MNKTNRPPDWYDIATSHTLPEGVRNLEPSTELARLATLRGRGMVKDLKIRLAEHRLAASMCRAHNPRITSSMFIHSQNLAIAKCCEAISTLNAELEYLKEFI